MKRLALVFGAALVLAPAAAADLPVHPQGSSLGEGVPLKAYASVQPTVHLFGDELTAKLAIIADTKWVDPSRLRVRTSFAPYQPIASPSVLQVRTGRFEQVTWTWTLRCVTSPCVPRAPPSDTAHVFHFHQAHVDYLTLKGTRAFGISANFPPVEVVSQVSPGSSRSSHGRTI